MGMNFLCNICDQCRKFQNTAFRVRVSHVVGKGGFTLQEDFENASVASEM